MTNDPIGNADDRRRFPRYSFEVLSLIHFDVNNAGKKIIGRTRDISAKGAFFNTQEPLGEDTPVKLDIFLINSPSEKKESPNQIMVIKVSGNVVRTAFDGMAVSFNEDFETNESSIEEITGMLL
jgi:hypothetical protein